MTHTGTLSKDDIIRLMEDNSPATQMDVVEKLATHYAAEGEDALNAQQSDIANDIISLLLARAEVRVRALLAQHLSQTDKLPAPLAYQMISDVNEVASPMLEFSGILSDAELVDIIGSLESSEKLQAIARRRTVSETVSSALVDTHIDSVVSTLVENEGAAIDEQDFEKIAQHHGENAEVLESLIRRISIPTVIVDKVISGMSDSIRHTLEARYGDLHEMQEMKEVLVQNLEMTRAKMLNFTSSDQELMHLLTHLNGKKMLSPFSALCAGSMPMFEMSLSRLLRIPQRNVYILLGDPVGFKAAYDQAGLPQSMFEATVLAVRAIRMLEKEKKGLPCSPLQVMERMQALSAGRTVPGVEFLYAMMTH